MSFTIKCYIMSYGAYPVSFYKYFSMHFTIVKSIHLVLCICLFSSYYIALILIYTSCCLQYVCLLGCPYLTKSYPNLLSKKYVIIYYEKCISMILRVFLQHFTSINSTPIIQRIFEIYKGKI